ncbi:MAG: phosphate ABC transporter substrate-binding protein [Gammaproteobacteria bacterium]
MRRESVGLALALGLTAAAAAQDDRRMAVIVHPERRAELSVDQLAQIYLRRKQRWDDGEIIVPLNLASGLPQRAEFSQRVLRQGEARLADYWNRRYFDGVMPPATLASTAAVRRYVAADRRAIGYLPSGEVDGSVRVILYLERP